MYEKNVQLAKSRGTYDRTIDDLEYTRIIEVLEGVTVENDTQNSVYLNVGNKGIFKYFKVLPKESTNTIFIQSEETEDSFMRGIHFEEADFFLENSQVEKQEVN